MRGWFDAFRTNDGPTQYASEHIAATHDNILIGIYTALAATFVAFLLIIPGIRHNKTSTLIILAGSMFVLASIAIGLFSPNWHVASSTLLASYKRSTPATMRGRIGVYIGLESFNVTLEVTEGNHSYRDLESDDFLFSDPSDGPDSGGLLQFNERYSFRAVDDVQKQYQKSLKRGLPYPILTVAEVMSMDAGGFTWGRSYRLAGYYAGILLWSSLASWIVMSILFCLVPCYSGYFMLITGSLMLLCNVLYSVLLPSSTLIVRFEDGLLVFQYGWCFWMVLCAGLLCVFVGFAITVTNYFLPELLSDLYSTWKYNSRLIPLQRAYFIYTDQFLYPTDRLQQHRSAPTATIQVLPLDHNDSLPEKRSIINPTGGDHRHPVLSSCFEGESSTRTSTAADVRDNVQGVCHSSNLSMY
ncbi:dual oxidase maturation factor 1-like [Paramacrobiotus metropolitanus]|uniref:dual oxidase maturation factor 1-like n=1 Tax=Paramacrobiotus metropolitanus TaxID=2943436 RepID=UPI0024458732|nr:dual oxidase maturation factor 1-like [Paramacrobiotus metropolitanus]